ncbi:MAG: DUF222 domain-containing protein [Mycobacterium sp.]
MFDSELSSLDDAGLVAVIAAESRAEAAAAGRRAAAIGWLAASFEKAYTLNNGDLLDWYAFTVAEVAAAIQVTDKAARRQVSIALALRDRLPKVAALYRQGVISSRLVSTITWRTVSVSDDAVLLVDTALADNVTSWGSMTDAQVKGAVDMWVAYFDPEGVKVTQAKARRRQITIGTDDDCVGVTGIWGSLLSVDAALLTKRLDEIAATVCRHDTRALGLRRSDALGALAAGADRLACNCGRPDCPAVSKPLRGRAVIHVLGEPGALELAPDPAMNAVSEEEIAAAEQAFREWCAANIIYPDRSSGGGEAPVGACHSNCVSPGWSIIGPPFGRTEGVFCDEDHAVGCWGEVGRAPAGGDVLSRDVGFADH